MEKDVDRIEEEVLNEVIENGDDDVPRTGGRTGSPI